MTAFHRFDPSACGFPPPRVPVLPPPGPVGLQRQAGPLPAGARWFRRGRYALSAAYRLAGLGEPGQLLVPSYHCRTMLDPAIELGAELLLYPLKADLAPDLAALEQLAARAAQGPTPIKALVLTHYFGLRQPLDQLVAFCARRGITLIEDCSHALVGRDDHTASLGRVGTYAIGSPYKFFAVPDGGLLWTNAAPSPASPPSRPSWIEEARAGLQALRPAGRRRPPPDVDSLAASPHVAGRDTIADEMAPSSHYDPTQARSTSLALSRWITAHTDLPRLIGRRRANYLQWVRAVAGLPGCRALFPVLADDAVPYMFPLYIERPDPDFYTLKRLGVPIWRWDEMARSTCSIAQTYRLHLLHLPCHQALGPDDMRWLTRTVAEVCARTADTGRTDAS